MGWFIYFGIVLVASLVLGWHLGRFRAACTEMTGMMAGMTIGMLGGFALGYGMAAAAGRDLFLGNLVGVILGAVLGGWFGRAGGLMGTMDGAMGGVMGGSMGAMIAAMIYPDWKLQWTGVLFGGVYVVGALALTALIESRTPDHEHLHWLLPRLTKAQGITRVRVARPGATAARSSATTARTPKAAPATLSVAKSARPATVQVREPGTLAQVARPIRDYYSMLNVDKRADLEAIEEAYLNLLASAEQETVELADRALTTLRDPQRRTRYDSALEESRTRQPVEETRPAPSAVAHSPASTSERGECCPPPKKKAAPAEPTSAAAGASQAVRTVSTPGAPVAPTAVAVASSSMATKPATQLPSKSKTPVATAAKAPAPAPARQAGQLPALKGANSALVSANTGNGRSNGHGNAGKQRSGKPGAQPTPHHESQQGAPPPAQKGSSQSRKAYRGPDEYTHPQPKSRGRGYVESDNGVGKRIMIGAGLGAVATLLVFWIAFSAASGTSGDQLSQDSYSNPAGSIYHAPGPVPSEAQLEGKAVVATVGADGVQTANLVLDEATSSYSPAAIKVKKGVPVRLNLSNTNGGRDCRSVVDITALGARGFIDSGQPSTLDFTPSQAGVFEINCPMRMVNPSYIVVTN